MDQGHRFVTSLFLATSLLIVSLVIAGCGRALEPTPTAPPGSGTGGEVGNFAPELRGITHWLNTGPLALEDLRGSVVLIDFWTYTCVNCIRTLPFLRDWHDRYAEHGLVIVGIHSPEFEFEKVTENVQWAATTFELSYPIAQDNDFQTWRAYSNRFWPAKYLVDKDGVVRYRHFGEGAYLETEQRIRELLADAGYDVSGIAPGDYDGPVLDENAFAGEFEDRLTREIYGGYERNDSLMGLYVAHPEYYQGPDRVVEYEDPGFYRNQFITLNGVWLNGRESLRHARNTEHLEDYIAFRFLGSSVNVVVGFEGSPYEIDVTMDGRPLAPYEAASDVTIEGGRSFVTVNEPRMYELVDLGSYGTGVLRLSSNSDQFEFFALTFGAYSTGP